MNAVHDTLQLRSFFSIPPLAYPHCENDPEHGEKNRKLFAFLDARYDAEDVAVMRGPDGDTKHLCLGKLIVAQAKDQHIPTFPVTGFQLPENGPFAYTTHKDPRLADLTRNLVMLVRR